MSNFLINRRGAVASLLAISATAALSACGNADETPRRVSVEPDLKYAKVGQFLGAGEIALLRALARTIMPATDTPGAVEAGVPETIQELASIWGDNAYRRYWRQGLADLGDRLSGDAGVVYADRAEAEQVAALSQLDAQVFDGDLDLPFYRDLKSTVLQAYYMSEPGATQELAYEPVPGEWIACAPLSDYPKTWAT